MDLGRWPHHVLLQQAVDTCPGSRCEGEKADVLILTREGLDELIAEGAVVASSRVDLARSYVGLAVKAGQPHPVGMEQAQDPPRLGGLGGLGHRPGSSARFRISRSARGRSGTFRMPNAYA